MVESREDGISRQAAPMKGRVCVVTGATAGIGKATARELGRQGATVLAIGRSLERCEETVRAIRAETGNTAVEFAIADLSSQSEIRRLAGEIRSRYPHVHVLVNNAGGIFTMREETVDGVEKTFALNHLAYFLLTNLLLETLDASAPARIVNVASQAHTALRTLDFDDLQGRARYRGFRAYCQSKLANVLFTYEMARRLAGKNVTVNALHPGFVSTNIFSGPGPMAWLARTVSPLMALRPDQGARTSVYLATSDEVEQTSGQYYIKCKAAKSSAASHDAGAARRLWEISAELTGLSAPGNG